MIQFLLDSFLFCKVNKILNLFKLSLNILNILFGFFIATALATISGQTGEWNIISGAIIIGLYEFLSLKTYHYSSTSLFRNNYINNIKIGILYGFFTDAFKLGS